MAQKDENDYVAICKKIEEERSKTKCDYLLLREHEEEQSEIEKRIGLDRNPYYV